MPARRDLGWLATFVCLLFACRAAEGAAPTITFEEAVHDFGTLPEGTPARHLFKVKNTGSAPLEIKGVAASCGCTAAAPKERQIAPGGSSEIEVTFDTNGRLGKTEKTVTVTSNDPKTPTTMLTIKVEVERLLGFEPAFTFLDGVAGAGVQGETWLSGKLAGGATPKISRLEPEGPVKVDLIDHPGGQVRRRGLRLTIAPRYIGHGTMRVVVATGLAEKPEIEHHVRWSVRGNVEAPGAVHLDLGQPGMAERSFAVSSRRPDFRLKAARVIEGPFRAALVADEGGKKRVVKLTATLTRPPAAPAQGKLVLESNDPLEPKKHVALTLAPLGPNTSPRPR